MISGMAGRLPECNDLLQFWENLMSGNDMVTEDGRRIEKGKPYQICIDGYRVLV